MYLGVVAVPTT